MQIGQVNFGSSGGGAGAFDLDTLCTRKAKVVSLRLNNITAQYMLSEIHISLTEDMLTSTVFTEACSQSMTGSLEGTLLRLLLMLAGNLVVSPTITGSSKRKLVRYEQTF